MPPATVNRAWPPYGVRPESIKAAETICKEAIKRSGITTASLAFSAGKDSICAAYVMQAFFTEVVPVYWYLVPGLGFIDRAMAYYEREVFGRPVIRLPHPDRFDLIGYWAFQPPNRLNALETIFEDVPEYTMDELWTEVRDRLGLTRLRAMHATGIRAADTPTRAGLYRKHGGFAPNGFTFYPVITWNSDDVEACLDHSRIALPPEYTDLGRSFDGIMRRYTDVIRRRWPEDWQRILDDFPLAGLEFFRAEQVTGVDKMPPLYKVVGRDRGEG